MVIEGKTTSVRPPTLPVSFGMSSEALVNKLRARAPDAPNAPHPHSENTSVSDEYLGMVREDTQEDYCGEEESEVDDALEEGEREDERATRGQESRMRENSKEYLLSLKR